LVLYRAFLVTALLTFLTAVEIVPAGQNVCVTCHRPHPSRQENCISCHRGDDRTERKEIAHYDLIAGRFAYYTLEKSPVVERGKELLDRLACRRCHRYAGRGNRLANNLDATAMGEKAQDIYDSIKSPALFMPNFYLDENQIAALVNAILARAKSEKIPEGETAIVVHFQTAQHRRKNVFAGQCGKCHTILSESSGGLGSGDIGPNLSGLFSEFYPRTYREAESWNPERLKRWLENPRDIRMNAVMQPLRLSLDEFDQLLRIMNSRDRKHP
jgi:mono/diheme cytochrome c family protein